MPLTETLPVPLVLVEDTVPGYSVVEDSTMVLYLYEVHTHFHSFILIYHLVVPAGMGSLLLIHGRVPMVLMKSSVRGKTGSILCKITNTGSHDVI